MSYQNELTPQQERSFKRRARFTVCGEPCDVFADPDYNAVQFVTINRNTETGASWFEATAYHRYTIDATEEVGPEFVRMLGKATPDTARRVIVQELRRWASMPEGTVAGYTPKQIAAEAERISKQA